MSQSVQESLNRILFYLHGGSENHGCEAIVQSLTAMLADRLSEKERITLLTNSLQEDRPYLAEKPLDIVEEKHVEERFLSHLRLYLQKRILGDKEAYVRYRFSALSGAQRHPQVAVSVGGDNYCYPELLEELEIANTLLQRDGAKTMLLGCSVEPAMLRDHPAMRKDLARYDRILARESLTYEALLAAGVAPEKLSLVPDPAFALKPSFVPLPTAFRQGHTVGLNVSPLVSSYAGHPDLVLQSYRELVRFLLGETDLHIALIPHVTKKNNNDLVPLSLLYKEFEDTGRIFLVENRSAAALKACIAACSLFVGARTHATIAAYSSMVPTLVVGYSVKARGIAKDLFGEEDHYVLPVQSMEDTGQLTRDFRWLLDHQTQVHDTLREVIPFTIRRAAQNAEAIWELIDEANA